VAHNVEAWAPSDPTNERMIANLSIRAASWGNSSQI
jgi:hypothetical protein